MQWPWLAERVGSDLTIIPQVNISTEEIDVTVAATENLLGIFEVPGGGAPAGSTWDTLPKTSVRISPSETLREVLRRAGDQLGVQVTPRVKKFDAEFRAERGEPPRTLETVDQIVFAEFRCDDDDKRVDESGTLRRSLRLKSTAVAVVRDPKGRAVWKRPPFEATMAELMDAAEVGLIDGDPLQPYLVLVVPQGGFGVLGDWNLFVGHLKLLWEITGAAAQIGGAWSFFHLVRGVMRRRSERATQTVEKYRDGWCQRGACPEDLIELVRRRPQRGESIAALLGCPLPEAEAVLWAIGCTEVGGRWVYRGDAGAELIADDLQLEAMFSSYRAERGARVEFERRLEQLGRTGSAPSVDEEKRQMSDEFNRKVEAEIEGDD